VQNHGYSISVEAELKLNGMIFPVRKKYQLRDDRCGSTKRQGRLAA
jgi:hypothetical protein